VTVTAVRRTMSRFLFNFLVIAALGMAQLLGVSRGFWCECAPVAKLVEAAACVPSQCHPHLDHSDGCHDESAGLAAEHDHGSGPWEHDHRHQEVRELLKSTAIASVTAVPPPVAYDLPPSMLVERHWDFSVVQCERDTRPAWVSDGSPPMPVLVARTMVMLV
jgi:hypothetical protein